MKRLFAALLFLVVLTQACTPQLPEALQKIQAEKHASSWRELTTYPIDRGRSDDLHFFDPLTGFVINSEGYLSYTEDGGQTWEVVLENPGTFFRCITFKNRREGWLGTIGPDDDFLPSKDTVALYETKDGGKNWTPVSFIGPYPKGLCGLFTVNDRMIVGTGRVRGPSFFVKTTDGGQTWYSYDLSHLAGSLIAAHFFDEQRGFLIGGTTNDKENSRSMVLATEDGGTHWDTVYLSEQVGEYPWKFAFPTPETGYVSIQRNVRDGRFYHLQTTDGGRTWREVEHTPEPYYVQGIGFIDQKIGWIGGSQDWTYETRDGGRSWSRLKNIGDGFNNFQFFGDSLAYGVGFGVFKNSNVQAIHPQDYKTYYSAGQLHATYRIAENKRNGPAQTFHPNGALASSGAYKENLKDGFWTYFTSEGDRVSRVKIRKGVAKISPAVLDKYIGDYETGNGQIRKVFLEEGQVYSQRGNGGKLVMFPESESRFFYGFNPDVVIEFIAGPDGNITHSRTFQQGRLTEARKL